MAFCRSVCRVGPANIGHRSKGSIPMNSRIDLQRSLPECVQVSALVESIVISYLISRW